MPFRRLVLFSALATLLTSSGCRDAKIVSYRVPKESPPPAAANPHAGMGLPSDSGAAAPGGPMSGNMAGTPVPTASDGDLTWTAPAAWQARPASAMRKATFIIAGDAPGEQAELAVTAFPGDVGGNLANVNRWRTQLQLPPITAGELGAALVPVEAGNLHAELAELVGPAPVGDKPRQRVLGVIVPFNGATWFFKLSGPDALVAREKDAFLSFLKTLQPAR